MHKVCVYIPVYNYVQNRSHMGPKPKHWQGNQRAYDMCAIKSLSVTLRY